jgi:hypothetical protein
MCLDNSTPEDGKHMPKHIAHFVKTGKEPALKGLSAE